MRGKFAAILVGTILTIATQAGAQENPWWKTGVNSSSSEPTASGSLLSAVTLGKPVPLVASSAASSGLTPVSFYPDYTNQQGHVARAQNPDPSSPTLAIPGPS